jgi:hypothetical protein
MAAAATFEMEMCSRGVKLCHGPTAKLWQVRFRSSPSEETAPFGTIRGNAFNIEGMGYPLVLLSAALRTPNPILVHLFDSVSLRNNMGSSGTAVSGIRNRNLHRFDGELKLLRRRRRSRSDRQEELAGWQSLKQVPS